MVTLFSATATQRLRKLIENDAVNTNFYAMKEIKSGAQCNGNRHLEIQKNNKLSEFEIF